MKNLNLAYKREVSVQNDLNESNDCTTWRLTDGSYADLSVDTSWVGVQGGIITLSLDFGNVFSVSGFDIRFVHDVPRFCCPEIVKLLLSENGTDFFEVARVKAPFPASFKSLAKATYSTELSDKCRARYAQIRFRSEIGSRFSELKIFGNELDGSETYLSGATVKDNQKGSYASPETLGGISDIPLLSFGYISEQSDVLRLKREDFRPVLGYTDNSGNVKDVMFKSVAICNSVLGECPSGGCLTYFNEKPSVLSDWEFLIDELFAEDANLKALNEEYASIKSSLAIPRTEKLKVFLTVPVSKISLNTFGDVNGDGIEEKLLTTEDCISAFNWYVDAVTRRFEAECLPELKIEGFIWNNNRITRELRDDEEFFVRECVTSLHSRNYKCLFVGSQLFAGVERIGKIGFDCAVLSPIDSKNGIQTSAISLCKKYGLGINISSPTDISNKENRIESVQTFGKQLSDAVLFGMTNTVRTYNQANVFYSCSISEDENVRLVYDGLYEFINQKTLVPAQEVGEQISESNGILNEESLPFAENVEVCEESTEKMLKQPVEEVIEEPVEEAIEEPVEEVELIETVVENDSSLEEPMLEEREAAKNENTTTSNGNVYEIPTLKIEISVPSVEENCPDRRCGYCNKFQEQQLNVNETAAQKQKNNRDKKAALVAAGIALVLGTTYLITKNRKGNNNG